MISDFLRGISYVPRGFGMLTERGLRRYVAVPLVINVLVFTGLFWLGAEYYQALLDWLLPRASEIDTGDWLGDALTVLVVVLRWLLWPLFILAGAVVMFYTFTAVANLISAPFNGMLSARVEYRSRGRMPADMEDGGLFVEAATAVTDELRKIAHFALLGAPLLVLFFIPVVNVVAPFVWGIYGAWIIALEYSDYPLGNHGLRFVDQRVLIRQRRFLHLGLGAGLLAMTLIPGVNLLVMPTGVIAATLMRSDLGEYRVDGAAPLSAR